MISYNLIKHNLYSFAKKGLFQLIKLTIYLLIYLNKLIRLINQHYVIPIINKIENYIYQQACNTFDCHKQ
jgi:hypothetical protein